MVLNCIVSNDVEWLLVTEFDAYFRNNETIDDCALNHTEYGYSKDLQYVQSIGGQGKTKWTDHLLFIDRFEILVTGGVRGYHGANDVYPFLGHVTNSLIKTQQQQHVIYTSRKQTTFVTFARKLQNFNRSASGYQWRYVSKAFFDKGFYCIDPFSFRTSQNPVLAAAAIILTCLTQKKYDGKDHKTMMSVLWKIDWNEKLGLPTKQPSIIMLYNKVQKGSKLSKAEEIVISIVYKLRKSNVNSLSIQESFRVYNSILYSKCKEINDNAVSKGYALL